MSAQNLKLLRVASKSEGPSGSHVLLLVVLQGLEPSHTFTPVPQQTTGITLRPGKFQENRQAVKESAATWKWLGVPCLLKNADRDLRLAGNPVAGCYSAMQPVH